MSKKDGKHFLQSTKILPLSRNTLWVLCVFVIIPLSHGESGHGHFLAVETRPVPYLCGPVPWTDPHPPVEMRHYTEFGWMSLDLHFECFPKSRLQLLGLATVTAKSSQRGLRFSHVRWVQKWTRIKAFWTRIKRNDGEKSPRWSPSSVEKRPSIDIGINSCSNKVWFKECSIV